MKKISIFLIMSLALCIASCSENKKPEIAPTQKVVKVKKSAPTQKVVKETQKKAISINTGWYDPDTYTVKALGADENSAIKKAKFTILKDIIKVRTRKYGAYQQISKISSEFEIPLKEGRIIKKRNVSTGIEIYFQIKDKGLKEKFEKK
jgi:PBP1b-binding outer membrane lipoprotein LpoB